MYQAKYLLDFNENWRLSEQNVPIDSQYLGIDLRHKGEFQTSIALNLSHQSKKHPLLYLENSNNFTLPLSPRLMQDLTYILGKIAIYDQQFSKFCISRKNEFRISTSNKHTQEYLDSALEAQRNKKLEDLFSEGKK